MVGTARALWIKQEEAEFGSFKVWEPELWLPQGKLGIHQGDTGHVSSRVNLRRKE